MGNRPTPEHSLDRINNNKGYNKNNCRWATSKQQHSNKRNNILLAYKGQTKTLAEWARINNISYNALHYRLFISKWEIEDAFNLELDRGRVYRS